MGLPDIIMREPTRCDLDFHTSFKKKLGLKILAILFSSSFIFTHFNTKRNGIGKYEFIQVSREPTQWVLYLLNFNMKRNGIGKYEFIQV